jgi:hypothetical protein
MNKMATLEPGWLKKEFDSIEALERARGKIVKAAKAARDNGRTRPVSIEFTIAELRELAYAARLAL